MEQQQQQQPQQEPYEPPTIDFTPIHKSDDDQPLTTTRVSLDVHLDRITVPTPSLMPSTVVTTTRDAQLVVLDSLFDRRDNDELLAFLSYPNWNLAHRPPPVGKWERKTSDGAGLPLSYGLRDYVLKELPNVPAMKRIESRLCHLYPNYHIVHQPHHQVFNNQTSPPSSSSSYQCQPYVANAAAYGDCYQWHVDADPLTLHPNSQWCRVYGSYANGTPDKPLFVSLLIYLVAGVGWPLRNDSETLFIDRETRTGIFVRPTPYRAIVASQDILHRLTTPSQLVGNVCRYSIVWKLLLLPKTNDNHQWSLSPPSLSSSSSSSSSVPFGSVAVNTNTTPTKKKKKKKKHKKLKRKIRQLKQQVKRLRRNSD